MVCHAQYAKIKVVGVLFPFVHESINNWWYFFTVPEIVNAKETAKYFLVRLKEIRAESLN